MSLHAPLLVVSGLVVRYGAITAVRGLNLEVADGETVGIVGPNGAGKTSLLAAIAGIAPPLAGRVTFAGATLSGIALEDVVGRGIALVPEGRHIFAALTVRENLLLGATVRRDAQAVRNDIERAFAMFPILWRSAATSLPGNCPAANSNSWPLRAHFFRARGFSCSTNLRLGSRRRLSIRFTRFCTPSKARASPFSLWSRTPNACVRFPIGFML